MSNFTVPAVVWKKGDRGADYYAYSGSVRVGSVFWDASRPRGEDKPYSISTRLPGFATVATVGKRFAELDEAKAELERLTAKWFSWVLMQPVAESKQEASK